MNEIPEGKMQHLDEMTLLLYIERQLDRARGLEVSAHTQECDVCRTLLRALERESRVLTRASATRGCGPARCGKKTTRYPRDWRNFRRAPASRCNGFGEWFLDWQRRACTRFIQHISNPGSCNWKERDSGGRTCSP